MRSNPALNTDRPTAAPLGPLRPSAPGGRLAPYLPSSSICHDNRRSNHPGSNNRRCSANPRVAPRRGSRPLLQPLHSRSLGELKGQAQVPFATRAARSRRRGVGSRSSSWSAVSLFPVMAKQHKALEATIAPELRKSLISDSALIIKTYMQSCPQCRSVYLWGGACANCSYLRDARQCARWCALSTAHCHRAIRSNFRVLLWQSCAPCNLRTSRQSDRWLFRPSAPWYVDRYTCRSRGRVPNHSSGETGSRVGDRRGTIGAKMG